MSHSAQLNRTSQVFGAAALLARAQSWRKRHPRNISKPGALLAHSGLFLVSTLMRPKLTVWLPQGVLILIAATLFYGIVGIPADIVERGIGFTYREEVWSHVIQRIPEHFWFGIGLAKDTDTDIDLQIAGYIPFHHAHSAYLDTLFRTGILGLLLAIAHLFCTLRHWRINPQLLPLYLWLIYGVICLSSNTRILFWQLDAKWLLYWIPAGLIAAIHITRHPQHPPNNR